MRSSAYFLLLSAMLFGCQCNNQKAIGTGGLIKINIANDYPSREVRLQDIADIEYVPLETRDDVLLSAYDMLSYVSDKYIFVWQRRSGDMFVFNRSGKTVSHFNGLGRGGQEYSQTGSVVFDEKNEEIFVFDNSRILVYSIAGAYKRALEYAGEMSSTAYNFDDETLLVYDDSGVAWGGDYKEEPYLFLSKKDGGIVSALEIKLPIRYSNTSVTFLDGNSRARFFSANIPNSRYYGGDFVIADISSDTIFKLSNNKDLIPFMVRTPSVHSSEPRTVWSSELNTDMFILLVQD